MKSRLRNGRAFSRHEVEKPVTLTVMPPDSNSDPDLIRVEFRKRLSEKKRKSQRRFTFIVISVLALMVMPIIRDLYTYYKLSQEYEVLQQQNKELLEIKAQLEEELESLDDPKLIEKLARENLGLVMPGESKIYQAIPVEGIPKHEEVKKGEALH